MKKFFQNKIKLLISLTFLILFVFNTVAYSGLATKLAITSEAMFRPITDIRVTDIKLDSATNGAVESYSPKFNVDTTTTGFVLPNANSTITYKVKVTNYGNVNQTIYNFIKNSINSSNVNIKITDFTSVCADDSCSQKNSDFTIIHHNGDNTTDSNEKEILITFSTSAPSDQAINVIEKYDFRPIYNINYDANGGQNAPKSQIKIYKDNLTLTTDEPTRPSYKFLGWSTSSKSTTAEYKAGDSYNPGTNEEVKDIILYAVWQKKQAKLDLNYNIDGTWYYSGYNNKIQTGIKVNGEDKGYLNDFDGTYDYGTIYEIYGFKIDGVTIPYSKKYTVDGTNHLGISFNTINFKVNDTNLGSVTPTQLIVIPETTFTISSNVITLSDGRIATASTKDVTGYKTKFSSYTITPNSTTINAKTTAQANFTKEAEKYTITLDNKNATTAGTTTIYEKYNTGIYLDSALTKVMTTTTNPIAKPAKTGYTFKGYYTKENGQGDQIINENGYITEKATNTTYKANTTLYAYYKDETKPTLTLTNSSNGNWTNKDVTITLNGADSGSGIKEYQLKYSGSSNAWKKTTAPKDTWGAERNETVYYRTVDNAGNESDAVSTSIRIDKTAPKIELNGTASSSEINNSNNVTIPIKITETASGINNSEFTASDVSVLINGTTVNPSTKTLTYNSVSNGVYSYTLTLSGITLNGKISLEIAAGAVKDIATNSNSKTTLDPSITVSNIYTISLNGNGTPAIYEKYNTGIYLDSALTSAMTTSANPITKPTRSYTVSFNANSTGITIPSAITKSYSYSGYYTDATNGTQMINENGYITSSFTKTSYTSNGTLYAHWKAKPSVTIPSISKTGYTCSWNTSADGKGTTYNAGDVTDKLNTQTLYVVCKANSYTVSYNSNDGSGTMTNDTATYDSNFITKKNTFTKTGYTFNGWNEKADGTGTVWGLTTSGVYESGKTWKWTYTKNITLYAQWKANTNTKYVVKHYKQKLDGTYPSEADDTDNLTGTADSSVSPVIKSYAGFTAPSVQTVTISADGSTVVTYKYTRNKYTFTLGSTTGITTTGSTASGSYYYGSTITLKASANTGYIFTGWTSSNTNLVANQTNASATFTMPVGNITMTPSTGYASYTVTYDATTNGGSTAKQIASIKYKSLVDLTKKAEKSGYEFVGWNTNKDATSALSSYEMPAKNVTLYAIYKKTLTATFNYYNSKSETKSVTIYNNDTSGSITSPAALGTPSGYTFRHYSTSNIANAAKTIDANSAVVLTGNQTYYASYQKNVTLNFYYHSGTDAYANKQTSTTATGVQYLGYNNAIVNSTVSIPSAVAGSTGYCGTSYKGVTAANSTTPISVNTGTTNYYAYYQATITYYYYNGSAHTTGAGTRTAYSNGTNYVTTASAAPTPSSYDGAAFKGWSYTNDSVNDRNPAYTAMTALYAYYQKTVNATFNYYDGSKAASVTAGNTRTYISKSGGVNTINTNITIPDAAKASRGSYTYRGISTSNAANASVVTPTTANTTYYSSYTYAITANFTANGGTGTAPSSAAGTGYMNYSGSKIGISVTMPSNTFTRNGYTFGGWYDSVVNKTYAIGTSVTIDSTRDITVKWNVNELTFSNQSKTITYSESSQSFNISGASNGTGSYSYSIISGDTNGNFSIDGLTISTNKDKVPPTGTYQLTVRAKDINSGKTKDAIITITIKPATITYTASSYEGFYDGNSHTISVSVTKPTSGATITYSLTENGTYSATKPTVTNATTTPVTVYFKISASNYNTVSSKATITINKTNSVSPTLTAYSGTYDGKPHTIGVTGGSGGTIKYSTDQTNWSTTLPTRTDATTTPVTVYVKVFGDGNHKDTSIISSTITINKKTDVITMSSISTNYTGQKVEATATAESKTTITYTYYNGTTCSGTALSSAPVNVGDYSVKATSTGNNNYKSNSTCATIKISNTNNPTTVSAVAGLKYGSTGNLVTTSNVQGTIYYSIGTELTSSNYKTSGSKSIPTASGKNAYTYKIYYYVDATGTNYESTKGGPVSVTISKALGSISYATKSVTKDYGNASFVNTLTKTGDGTITSYLSSNTGVATIDTAGKVTIIAAGTTTITAKVTDGTNYTYSTKTATYTLVVNKIENTAKVSPVTGIIYGDSKSMVNVSGVQGTIYYSVGTEITEANYLSIGSTTIPASTGRNAGDYNIYYFVKGNSNYKNTSGSVKVTISAKTLSIPVSPNAKTYNGNPQESGITCPAGSTAGGTQSATNQGTYTQTCTLNSTSNYVWSDKTTTAKSISWKIDPKKITITASNQTVTYGTAIAQGVSKVSVATLVSGHNLSAITLTQSTTNAPGGTISASGAKIVSGSTDVTSNYSITYKTGILTINAKALSIPVSPNAKTYNGNPQESGITCPAGSTAGGTQSATNQGTYTQTCTLNSTSNYVWSDKTTTAKSISWKIDPKKITITASNQTVTYGTAIAQGVSKVSVATLVSGHNLSAITLTQSTTNAPGGTISASGAKILSGSTDVTGNYAITYKTGTLTINAKTLTIPSSPNEKTYNGNPQGSGITCPAGSTAGGTQSATNQGTYTQTCTLNSTSNYVWSDKTTTAKSISWKIDPKKITITASNQTVTYGTAIAQGVSKVSVATLVSGHNLSAITLTQSTTNAPGGTISASGAKIVSGSTDVTGNYAITYAAGTLTINAKTLTIPSNPNEKTYNGNPQGSGITCPAGSTAGGTQSATNQGTYTQTCTLNSTSNYVWSDKTTTAKSISWKIDPKKITITASNQTVTYGTAIAQGVSKVSVATLVSGHNLSAITLTQSTTNAPGGTISASGAKIVSGSTDVTSNYSITYKTGILTINAKALSIPVSPNAKTYNGNPQESGITCPAGSTAGGTQSATNQGTYTQTCTLNSTSNYVWSDKTTTAKSISWKIDPKKITITASNQTVTYGTAIAQGVSKVSVATLVSGHNLSAITLTQSTTNAPGGTISASGAKILSGSTDVTGNYAITYKTGTLTINAKTLTIPSSPNEKTYNGNPQGSGITCPAGSTAGGTQSATNQGTYTQTCTLNSTSNYVWSDKTTTAKSISWKIDPKKITITASNQTVTYGTAIAQGVSKVSVATLVSGHNLSAITLTQSTTNAPGGTISASGAKIVSGSTDVTSNYSMTYKTGTLTINPATLLAPTNIKISTAGIVTWDSVSNASSYQISMDNANWTAATSGVDYLSKLIASTGSKTVYVRAVGTGNYSTSNNGTASTIVYTVTVNSNSTTMGTVDTSSYNVISGATYSASSNKLSFIGTTTGSTTKTLKTVTATAKSNYTFNNWSSVSGSITSNVTLTANFNSSEFTISLNPNGGTGGTSAIYERYNKGIYLDSGTNSKQMTTSANAITKPTKEPYTISFNANNTGATVPSNYSFSPVFNGYYTATTSNGTQMIDNRGYITNNLTSTKYTSNTTLYAQWNHYYTLPSLSKGGNTCKWAIGSASGTKYNSGTSLFINDNKVFYAVCTPKSYTVTFNGNGGTSSLESKSVTYGSAYGTLPTATRSNTTDSSTGKTISYVFEGWYTAASGGTKIESTTTYNTVGNQILYAHWLSSPNIKGGTAESWSSTAVTISLNIPSTSDTGTVSYQYYLSETNELPESATWIDITSADGSVSISKNGEFYIFYKATSSAGVSITSNYNKLQIDTQTPSTSITAYQAGTTTTVASNKWINKNLEFKMGALNVGPSSGSIYYCIGDNCTPNTLISPNTAIPADLTNTKTGIYKVRYKAVSNAGLSSSIGEYVAKVDKTAPTMKAVVKSLKDNSTLANLTNSSTTYIDSTWRSYGYSINLNGTTDSQSGISSIERFTNANNLKRADADYKANLHKGVITDTKTFSESGDGAKYAKFVATDNAGNTTTFTVEVLIDKTAPTVGVNIYKAKDASTKTGSVICALPTSLSNGCKDAFPWTSYGYYFDLSSSSDALSGIDHYTMRYTAGGKSSVDTSSYSSRTISAGTAHTTVTSSGARRLEFTATDKAGNTSTVEAKNVYIDMDDPNLVIKLYKADSSGNKTGSVLKTITDNNTAINSWTNYRHYFDLSGSSDSLSGIEKITMQINDSGIVTTGNTATGTSDLKTTYTITSTKHQVVGSSGNRYARFTITDKVGNTSVKNVRIYIDLDAPTLNSASLSPQFQSSTTIKYTCSDKTSGFASFGTKTLSKTYTKNVTSSNSPVKIQCKDTAGNTSSGTRTYTWSANSDKCGTTTEDVYSNGYYCDAGNAASANSSACISYATNTGKTTKYVNKRCMYYCNAKTGTTTVAKTCWHQ